MPAIDLRDITARYPGSGTPAVDGVSLRADGELVALLGPNGSGKSTLMRVLIGQHRAEHGEVASPTDRRMLGVVFQSPAVDDLLTVTENLRLAAALHGLGRRDAAERAGSLARSLGLIELGDRRCGRLSGGQRRRVDLARALMGRPRVLVLDEPTTGLDMDARAQFWQVLDAVRRDEGVTVLYATHLGDEAERADRAVLMRAGRVVAEGTPEELRRPLGSRVARVDRRPAGDAQTLREWVCGLGADARWWSGGAVIAEARSGWMDSCPPDATLRVSAPLLEDVYLWHTGTAEGGDA